MAKTKLLLLSHLVSNDNPAKPLWSWTLTDRYLSGFNQIHCGALSGSNESGKSRPEVWKRESLDFAIVRVAEW